MWLLLNAKLWVGSLLIKLDKLLYLIRQLDVSVSMLTNLTKFATMTTEPDLDAVLDVYNPRLHTGLNGLIGTIPVEMGILRHFQIFANKENKFVKDLSMFNVR